MSALTAIAPALACPVCREPMAVTDRVVRCARGHNFDIARQGYLNLMGRAAPRNADTPAMIAARHRFLSSGRYAAIGEAIAELAPERGLLLDSGAGPGHYAAALLDDRPGLHAIALDVSPAAARAAARAHPRLASVVADVWDSLPIRDTVLDGLLCVFAPRNPAEFARILRPEGRLIIVSPGPGHLRELRTEGQLIGIQPEKDRRLEAALAKDFEITDRRDVLRQLQLTAQEIVDLRNMGPSAFHGRAASAQAAHVSLEVRIRRARRR